jgi:hypothetical protein
MVIYAVDSFREIDVIINHFDKYSLITKKLSDFLIFKQCFNLIKQKEHLTDKGLLEIMSLKGSLNLGLPENIKNVLCFSLPTGTRNKYKNQKKTKV